MADTTLNQSQANVVPMSLDPARQLDAFAEASRQAFDEVESEMCDIQCAAHRAKCLCDVLLVVHDQCNASDSESVLRMMDRINALTMAIRDLSDEAATGATNGQGKAAAWLRRIDAGR